MRPPGQPLAPPASPPARCALLLRLLVACALCTCTCTCTRAGTPGSAPAAHGHPDGRDHGVCTGDADCSRLGRCRQDPRGTGRRACACSPGWTGAYCEQLDLVAAAPGSGLDLLPANGTSTWGGAVVKANGAWHMLYSELAGHCGINAWLSNSVVAHAVSGSPLGGFARRRTVWPLFSHEPTLATAPTGETVVFFTHNDGPATFCPTCDCAPQQQRRRQEQQEQEQEQQQQGEGGVAGSVPGHGRSGNSTPSCPPDWDKDGRDPATKLQTYMSYTSDFAAWSSPVPVPQRDVHDDTAFSAVILGNGSLVAMTRTDVIVARDWRDTGGYRSIESFKASGAGAVTHPVGERVLHTH